MDATTSTHGAGEARTGRRAVLRAGLFGAGALVLSQAFPGLASGLVGGADGTGPTAAAFDALVGERFTAQIDGVRSDLVLESVDAFLEPADSAATGERFSLLFAGPLPAEGQSGSITAVTHPNLGRHDVFLAPVGGANRWEVIVDHRRPKNHAQGDS